MFLLVTLESGQREEHRYDHQFLPPSEFQCQSQNRTPQTGKVGQALKNHGERRINVHLFVCVGLAKLMGEQRRSLTTANSHSRVGKDVCDQTRSVSHLISHVD